MLCFHSFYAVFSRWAELSSVGAGSLFGRQISVRQKRSHPGRDGHSLLTNDYFGPFHGFLWTEATGMQDLGTLPGQHISLALGINDRSQIIGTSKSRDRMAR